MVITRNTYSEQPAVGVYAWSDFMDAEELEHAAQQLQDAAHWLRQQQMFGPQEGDDHSGQ